MSPPRPITAATPRIFHAVVAPLQAFFRTESASGVVLLVAAAAALLWANLSGDGYRAVFHDPAAFSLGSLRGESTLAHAISDGLMAVFFFVVGMEIKRELSVGELRSFRRAVLPLVAALGGMVMPALIYIAFNAGGPGQPGWAIPMATDIAFSIGVLTLLGPRVPHGLTVFVLALAIFDDIGGILVIAAFYGHAPSLEWLGAAAAVVAAVMGVSVAGVRSPLAYLGLGGALWYALLRGGVHPTMAGVVVGLAVPARCRQPPRALLRALRDHVDTVLARGGDDEALDAQELLLIEETIEDLEPPLDRFLHALHPWVAFGVMPLFALANAGVQVDLRDPAALLGPVAAGTLLGLVAGKTLGVFSFTWVATRLKLAPVPGEASRPQLLGAAAVAGIGFTVALFIAGLSFPRDPHLLDQAKLAILAGSLLAGLVGAAVLRVAPSRPPEPRVGNSNLG